MTNGKIYYYWSICTKDLLLAYLYEVHCFSYYKPLYYHSLKKKKQWNWCLCYRWAINVEIDWTILLHLWFQLDFDIWANTALSIILVNRQAQCVPSGLTSRNTKTSPHIWCWSGDVCYWVYMLRTGNLLFHMQLK